MSYIPKDAVTQSFKSNKGVLTTNQIIELDNENKFTKYGQLELLQTQTISGALADFTQLQESVYDVHLFTFTDIHFSSQTEFDYRLSNDGGTTFETGYSFANNRVTSDGGISERKTTSQNSARLFGDIDNGANSAGSGYMYLYNAGNSRFTHSLSNFTFMNNDDKYACEYGSQTYNHEESISAIRFGQSTSMHSLTSAIISVYGIRSF